MADDKQKVTTVEESIVIKGGYYVAPRVLGKPLIKSGTWGTAMPSPALMPATRHNTEPASQK